LGANFLKTFRIAATGRIFSIPFAPDPGSIVIFVFQRSRPMIPPELRLALLRVLPFLIVIVVFRIAIVKGRLNAKEIGLQVPVSFARAIVIWALFAVFMLSVEFALYKTGLLEVSSWKHALPESVIRILGIVIFAPVAEELFFRGVLLHKLKQWVANKHLAVAFQAIIFVLLHSFAYQNTLSSYIGIVQATIDATIYGYTRLATRSIYPSMAMHATGNLVAVLEQLM
jgi:membrane protease YdiL (CAAX protease family)